MTSFTITSPTFKFKKPVVTSIDSTTDTNDSTTVTFDAYPDTPVTVSAADAKAIKAQMVISPKVTLTPVDNKAGTYTMSFDARPVAKPIPAPKQKSVKGASPALGHPVSNILT